jgi:hypothetical protein
MPRSVGKITFLTGSNRFKTAHTERKGSGTQANVRGLASRIFFARWILLQFVARAGGETSFWGDRAFAVLSVIAGHSETQV